MAWKTLSTEKLISDYHVYVQKNKVQLPDGAVINDFYTVTIPDAAMVAAITTDGKILLKSEYRYACGEVVIECPAGMVEEGEDPIDTAKRELIEETGYSSDSWTYFGLTWESTSKLTNHMYLFLAKDCKQVSSQHLDENEHVDVMRVSLEAAVGMVMDGTIKANSTAHLILKVARMIDKNHRDEYDRWLHRVADEEIQDELRSMDTEAIEDAFYRDLAFGTGGLRGILGAGTNRMNKYVVGKASYGLAQYLLKREEKPSVVIGYDSRLKSDEFAKVAAGVFTDQGIHVFLWSTLNPVPTVSFAVRELKATAGVMITASHNPAQYNGYKVYGADGCQITTEAAEEILTFINTTDIFEDPYPRYLDWAESKGLLEYIDDSLLTSFIEAVKGQSVLFGDKVDKNVSIVYSPLNGTGLVPVTRCLQESGFTNITVVEEQRDPDGYFPTCPYPNPEIREAMELGLEYCKRTGADLLLATDPDCDRCGIAVRAGVEYKLLTGNEVGLLLLDYICSQRVKHKTMPDHPVFIKTIVTMDLAERIAEHYGVRTVNVLTGFKFIGEQIGELEKAGREADFICGFEESYGYLTGSYVRDKDGVNAAFMICEMFAYYKTRGISLLEKLEELYKNYGFCLNTLHSYEFPGSSGMEKMSSIMQGFHAGLDAIAGIPVTNTEDYLIGLNGLPPSDVMKYFYRGDGVDGSVVIRPSATEPKLKAYISVTAKDRSKETLINNDIPS